MESAILNRADRLSARGATTGTVEPAEPAGCPPLTAPAEAADATVASAGPLLWVHRSSGTNKATGATAALEAQVAGLREVCHLLRQQLDEARHDCERWRSQAEAMQRLITETDARRHDEGHQHARRRSEAAPESEVAQELEVAPDLVTGTGEDQRPWWRRTAGRAALQLITLLGCIALMLTIIANLK